MKRSLAAFAKDHTLKKGPPCSVCSLPPDILKQVHEAGLRRGVTRMTIAAWLIECGFDHMNRQRIEHHFNALHPETRWGIRNVKAK